MSDDLNNKIKQITDILGQENLPDNVKGLLNLLANPDSKEQSSQKNSDTAPAREQNTPRSELEESVDMMRKMKTVMDRMSATNSDPRVNLLNAIRPFLNKNRQKKVGDCVNLLRMSSFTKLIEEKDK